MTFVSELPALKPMTVSHGRHPSSVPRNVVQTKGTSRTTDPRSVLVAVYFGGKMAGTRFHLGKTAKSDCVETGLDQVRCQLTGAGFAC